MKGEFAVTFWGKFDFHIIDNSDTRDFILYIQLACSASLCSKSEGMLSSSSLIAYCYCYEHFFISPILIYSFHNIPHTYFRTVSLLPDWIFVIFYLLSHLHMDSQIPNSGIPNSRIRYFFCVLTLNP